MKTRVPQGGIIVPILFLIYTKELHYVLENLGVFYQGYAEGTRFYFTFEGITEAENNKVGQWMCSTRLKLNSNKIEYILATANNSMHENVDNNTVMLLMLENIPAQLSNSVRNLGFMFDYHLNLDEQINNMKKNVINRPPDQFFSQNQRF